MPLIKTLSQTLKQDKEKFKVPKSVQQAIPIRKIWPDGIFQVESKYSRTFRFTDINYSIASKADKTEMFLDYSELLNALDSGCTAKITLNNRKINKVVAARLSGFSARYSSMYLSAMGDFLEFRSSTFSGTMSTAVTSLFCDRRTAIESPTYPVPATVIFISFSP